MPVLDFKRVAVSEAFIVAVMLGGLMAGEGRGLIDEAVVEVVVCCRVELGEERMGDLVVGVPAVLV